MYSNANRCFLQSQQQQDYACYRNDNFEDELNNLFNKKFKFRFNPEWKMPDHGAWFSAPPWQKKELESMKSRLNFHKSQLNDFNIEEWSSHTRRRNPAGEVCWKLRCMINPEFLTQAWTKFYECAYTYNIIPPEAVSSKQMVSMHLCEAPGAFITSLNHYLKTNHADVNWNWVASTLNPYYEGNSPSNMISDDRFMFHTLNNWDFGVDNTGNLMDWENSQSIIKRANDMGEVLLVTADGSIDCLQKPDAQEEVTSPLHYCEVVTALQSLNKGGTLIYKLFTIFEHSTVNLLYLINHLFAEVNIYKPVTSRQGNSEVYAICLNYKGYDKIKDYLPKLQAAYGTDLFAEKSLFPITEIPEEFLRQVEECANYFCSIQCQVINNNLQAYLMQNNIAFHINIKKVRALVANEFITWYNLKPLLYNYEILKGVLHEENKINTNPRYHRGSYTERQLYTIMSLKEKSKNLLAFLNSDIVSNQYIFLNESLTWLCFYDGNCDLELSYTVGKPVERLASSKFIFVPIFKLYQQILEEEEFKEIVAANYTQDNNFSLLKQEIGDCQVLMLPEYNLSDNYFFYEKECFRGLVDRLKDLNLSESILLQNINILSHFNVSVLYILSRRAFEKICFTTDGVLLFNLLNKSGVDLLNDVFDKWINVKTDTKDLLSVLPVQITNDGDFFNNVVFYNNTFYRNKCVQYLAVIQQTI